MITYRINTFGPCCRCTRLARHILIRDGRRYIVHTDQTTAPCPAQPGEMPENGQPVEVMT